MFWSSKQGIYHTKYINWATLDHSSQTTTVLASKFLVSGLYIKKMLKPISVVDVPLVLDPTVSWDTDMLSPHALPGALCHAWAKLVQVFVEVTQEVEEEPEAHTKEEWQALLGID